MQGRAASTWGDISPGNLTQAAPRNAAPRTGEHQDHTTPSGGISEQQLDPELPGDLQQNRLSLLLDKDIPSPPALFAKCQFCPLIYRGFANQKKGDTTPKTFSIFILKVRSSRELPGLQGNSLGFS